LDRHRVPAARRRLALRDRRARGRRLPARPRRQRDRVRGDRGGHVRRAAGARHERRDPAREPRRARRAAPRGRAPRRAGAVARDRRLRLRADRARVDRFFQQGPAQPVTERVLTQRALNRVLLARQLLLERSRLSLPRALERIGGIQNQYAPNAYIRLWSCLDGFDRDALDRALERRSVVQATLMRGTIHVVSAGDYWPFAVGIRRAGRQWWLRVHRPQSERVDLAAANAALREFVSGTTRSRDEILQCLRAF